MFQSDKFIELKKEFDNKNNSHSYIFYTNDFFSCQKDVYELVRCIFNEKNLNILESDFFVVKKSDKKNILKEDMIDLKNLFQNTSYLNNYRVYLIEEAHKLNSTTSNMILKFLEEPMDGVIALFITDNLDAVLDTIKSRCQIVNVFYDIKTNVDISESVEKLNTLLFNSNKYISLVNIKKEFDGFDRNELIDLFKESLNYYCKKNLEPDILRKINVLNNAITMLSANVNFDYVFDYILLKGSDY